MTDHDHETTTTKPTRSVPALALSMDETAEALGLGRRKVWSLCRAGKLPHVKVGRRVLIPTAALERYLIDLAGDCGSIDDG